MKTTSIVIAAVLSFVIIGVFLPAFLPGHGGGEAPKPSVLRTLCDGLYVLQNMLPTGTPDSIRIPVGIFSLALWGAFIALIVLWFRQRFSASRLTTQSEQFFGNTLILAHKSGPRMPALLNPNKGR